MKSKYLELEKVKEAQEKLHAITDFIDFVDAKGWFITNVHEDWFNVEEVLAAFFEIDLEQVERERQAMLENELMDNGN